MTFRFCRMDRKKTGHERPEPLRAREIQTAVEELAGTQLSWNTVKDCLHQHARRPDSPVERVGHEPLSAWLSGAATSQKRQTSLHRAAVDARMNAAQLALCLC